MVYKSLAVNLTILTVTTVILLVVLEVTFRTFLPQPTINQLIKGSPAIYEQSDYLPWKLKPNTESIHYGLFNEYVVNVRINGVGLRNSEIGSKDGTFRILVLGDSFTFGYGVENEETYPAQLQKILNERMDGKVEVINAGYASGYAPDAYYAYLKKEGFVLQPDMVLIGFFVGNDFIDFSEEQWVEVDEFGLPVKLSGGDWVDEYGRRRQLSPGREFISNSAVYRVHLFFNTYSHVYSFVKHRLKNVIVKQSSSATIFYRKNYTFEEQVIFDKTTTLFRGIHSLTRLNNASLSIILIPGKETTVEVFKTSLKFYGLEPSEFDFFKVSKLMTEFGDAEGIPIIDLQPSLAEYARQGDEQLYFSIDRHWTPAGHKRVAEVLAAQLQIP